MSTTTASIPEATWHPVLDGALDVFQRTEEKSIRLVIGKHTVVVQKEGAEVVAVVLPTGHAIAKSLRRMIRRMARKDRAPLAKARAEPLSSPVVTPAAPAPTSAPPSTIVPSTSAPSTSAPEPEAAPASSDHGGLGSY